MHGFDSLDSLDRVNINSKVYQYHSLLRASVNLGIDITNIPYSFRVLLENILRNEEGEVNTVNTINSFVKWLKNPISSGQIGFFPARILMQDFTGVPALVDLAAMRDAAKKLGIDPSKINPVIPVDLVIDHSIRVDNFGTSESLKQNSHLEIESNRERYRFLHWGQNGFNNFRVIPPGKGICHQVNLEYLAQVVCEKRQERMNWLFPDTLVGTDSHTTMVNALSVLGWGVGGISAEVAMLGEPILMNLPEVVGVNICGSKNPGVTATDIVLSITQKLREHKVVNKFVEFFGDGMKSLSISDRATISNMAPEYGATCGFFPVDEETIRYLRLTGRSSEHIKIVETYAKQQCLWNNSKSDIIYSSMIEFDLSYVGASIAGPKRPQDRLSLSDLQQSSQKYTKDYLKKEVDGKEYEVTGKSYKIKNGDIVLASITSCTNTSNPDVMIAAGLLAKKAVEKGLQSKPWVKTSLAPGSQVVSGYLEDSGLIKCLEKLGFFTVGYGCTTCIGNSGPLISEVNDSIVTNNLVVASILSGNRNFEGRIHPSIRMNFLASPPLVVAYSIAGTTDIDITKEPLGEVKGKYIYLSDIWPSDQEIQEYVEKYVTSELFNKKYSDVLSNQKWDCLSVEKSDLYNWEENSTYIKSPPFFHNFSKDIAKIENIHRARILAILGDSITTDHISPAGAISDNSPAGKYLLGLGIPSKSLHSYGARRGNHEVMMRGTFANPRIRNEMCPRMEGGVTVHYPSSNVLPIYEAAMEYKNKNFSTIIIAGKEYGTGSSRDWAAKGTLLLGVKAVIAESFERIHRSNLVGMGVIPLTFVDGMTRKDLHLDGSELIDITLEEISPGGKVKARLIGMDSKDYIISLRLELYTKGEITCIIHNTILHKKIRDIIKTDS